MSYLADSGPAAGGTVLAVLSSLGYLVIWLAKWLRDRDRTRAMQSVPRTSLAPPGPAVDATVLARLRQLEEHQTLSAELARAGWQVDEAERELAALRLENGRLATQLKIERAAKGIADSLLKAKDEHIVRLQEDLARERTKRRGGAIEVAAEHEYRDASQAGPLADGLPTPLRPPAK
jgi:hypothetical protein